MEGAARGMYDTETLVKMGNNYLRTKLASFGGTSENEMDEEFRRFLGIKELQNVRGAIERGEQGAWNEYAEFAGLDAAKIDLAKVDQRAAEITGEFIDPTLLIPAGKLGGAASRAMARVASKPVRMARSELVKKGPTCQDNSDFFIEVRDVLGPRCLTILFKFPKTTALAPN